MSHDQSSEVKILQAKLKEQQESIDQLQHNLFYLNSIIRKLPGNVFWKDSQGVYLGCNDFVLEMAGEESIVGKTDYDLPWHAQADIIRAYDEAVMEKGEAVTSIDEAPILSTGEKRIYRATKAPLRNEEGKIVGLIGISYDVTAETEAKELRLEKVAAEERAETIRLIGMSIAHELRTPLRAISAGAAGIAKKLPFLIKVYKEAKKQGMEMPEEYYSIYPRDLELLDRVLKNIDIETQAAFSVIDMLLIKGNLSQINMEKFTDCQIADCVKDALKRYPFQEHELELIHWQGGDFTFHGDHLLMVHVLFNLIKNALYFIKAASKGEIQIWITANQSYNELHFKDTGPGMPPEVQARVFDRFFSTQTHGTGIGLAFCQLVMQSSGGSIKCDSIEGEYTEFVLTFPKMNSNNIGAYNV